MDDFFNNGSYGSSLSNPGATTVASPSFDSSSPLDTSIANLNSGVDPSLDGGTAPALQSLDQGAPQAPASTVTSSPSLLSSLTGLLTAGSTAAAAGLKLANGTTAAPAATTSNTGLLLMLGIGGILAVMLLKKK